MILFLDIDGVIATFNSYDEHADRLHRPAVRQLNRLLHARPFSIVISSTWRLHYDVDELRELLACLDADIIGVTPQHLTRGQEIMQWYNEHQRNDGFIVIDDDIREIIHHVPGRHIVHVEDGLVRNGFDKRHLRHALAAAERCEP